MIIIKYVFIKVCNLKICNMNRLTVLLFLCTGLLCLAACKKDPVEILNPDQDQDHRKFKFPDVEQGVLVFEEFSDIFKFSTALSESDVQSSFQKLCKLKGFLSLQESYNMALFDCGEAEKTNCSEDLIIANLLNKLNNTYPSFLASVINEDGIIIANGISYKFSDLKQYFKNEVTREWDIIMTFEDENLDFSNRSNCQTHYVSSAVNASNDRKLIYETKVFNVAETDIDPIFGYRIRWENGCYFRNWPEKKSWWTWNNYKTHLYIEANVNLRTVGLVKPDINFGWVPFTYNVTGSWHQEHTVQVVNHILHIGPWVSQSYWDNNQAWIDQNKLIFQNIIYSRGSSSPIPWITHTCN